MRLGRTTSNFSSRVLLAELTRILRRAKFGKVIAASGMSLDELVLGYAELVTLVAPTELPLTILRDPDDDNVLSCALAAHAEWIISGDHDLLDFKTFRGIPIVTASQAVRIVTGV